MEKILVLTSTFPRWQNDTEPPFVHALCKELSKEFEVFVLAPHSAGALITENFDNIKITRYCYFFNRFEKLCYQGGMLANLKANFWRYLLLPFFLIAQIYSANKLIKRENITIIHAHWLIPQGFVACFIKKFNKPLKILCTSHGGDLFSLKGKLFNFLKRSILLQVDGVTVVNSIMEKEVYTLCQPYKPVVKNIPMGVDIEIFKPSNQKRKAFSLLFVGRLVEKKGLEYLIRALPDILIHFPDTTLTIIGNGPLRSHLLQSVDTAQLVNHVIFAGAIPNDELPTYYQNHQIAVFPFVIADNGDREGLPVVISEAMACGCCVVTTDLPGMNDIVKHQHSGFIVPQRDSQAISNLLLELFTNSNQLENIAYAANSAIKDKNSWKVIGKEYKNFIQSIMSL